MSKNENRVELKIAGEKACGGCCNSTHPVAGGGLSRRNFLQGMGAAGVVVGSQLLDDMLCFAAESIPADGPTTVKPVVDVVSIWPKGHAKTGRMDWGYGTDTYNYQRNLYKEILEKAAKEIGVKV